MESHPVSSHNGKRLSEYGRSETGASERLHDLPERERTADSRVAGGNRQFGMPAPDKETQSLSITSDEEKK